MNKILLFFVVLDLLFLMSGAGILATSLVFKGGPATSTSLNDVASSLLLQMTPLAGEFLARELGRGRLER